MSHMTREILDACSVARSRIEDIISRSDADSILIIGVGNSSGIPDAVENPGEIRVKEKDSTKNKEEMLWEEQGKRKIPPKIKRRCFNGNTQRP